MTNPNIKVGNSRNTFSNNKGHIGGLMYPAGLGQSPNFFSINLRSYETGLTRNSISNPGVHISLPMPIYGLKNSFHMDYETKALGTLGAIGASIHDTLKDPLNGIESIGSGLANVVRGVLGGSAEAILGDTGASAAQLGFGAVNNPNLALLFKGVGLRTHQFTWELIASNKTESETIKAIGKTLKKFALPSRESGVNFALTYPYVAFPAIVGPMKNEMITFSEWGCFIEDVELDYSGHGHPAYFKETNDPVMVRLTVKMTERGIVTADDVSA
jgi:hypothetical protein